jgi:hypothetical protein
MIRARSTPLGMRSTPASSLADSYDSLCRVQPHSASTPSSRVAIFLVSAFNDGGVLKSRVPPCPSRGSLLWWPFDAGCPARRDMANAV